MNLMLNGIEARKDTGGVLTVKSQLRENRQIQISFQAGRVSQRPFTSFAMGRRQS